MAKDAAHASSGPSHEKGVAVQRVINCNNHIGIKSENTTQSYRGWELPVSPVPVERTLEAPARLLSSVIYKKKNVNIAPRSPLVVKGTSSCLVTDHRNVRKRFKRE